MKNTLITHLVCGYPSFDESNALLKILAQHSKYIEVQFPFSDPIADWEVISKANDIALRNWTKISDCFVFVEKNKEISSKIIIMTYFNIVYNYWLKEFILKTKSLWVFWIIIPDVPFDEIEWKELIKLCKMNKINFLYVVAPNTSDLRLEEISKFSTWFIYAISKTMTTWNEIQFWQDFEKYIMKLRKIFQIPIWVWFWIKTKTHIKNVCELADYAIIWSELIKIYDIEWLNWVEKYLKNLY